MTKNIRKRLTAIVSAIPVLGSTQVFAAGASEPGLPQLDIDTWPSQLFWLVVLFGVGYLVMAKMVTPRIGAVLEERPRHWMAILKRLAAQVRTLPRLALIMKAILKRLDRLRICQTGSSRSREESRGGRRQNCPEAGQKSC